MGDIGQPQDFYGCFSNRIYPLMHCWPFSFAISLVLTKVTPQTPCRKEHLPDKGCLSLVSPLGITTLETSFHICVIIWILNLFYRTTSSLKTHFFISRILDPITGDVKNIVHDNAPQIQQTKSQQNKWEKCWKLANWRVIPMQKASSYTLSKCIQIFTWAMASSYTLSPELWHLPTLCHLSYGIFLHFVTWAMAF